MILKPGEKIHVIARRLFEGEVRRHFVGVVKDANERTARLEGYVFVFDGGRNEFVRKEDRRVKLVSIGESGFIMNVLPDDVCIDDLQYVQNQDGKTVVSDGKGFTLDVNEFGANR